MRARMVATGSFRPLMWRRTPRPLDTGLTGPGAAMLWVAIFGRAEPPLRLKLPRLGAWVREIACGLWFALFAAIGLGLVLALRLALATHGSAPLRDWLASVV